MVVRRAPIVLSAARQRFQAEAERFEAGVAPLLADPDGSEMHLSLEMTVTLQATVRTDISVSTDANSNRSLSDKAERCYGWLREYLTNADHYREFVTQIAAVPNYPSGDVSQRVLMQCLDAAAYERAWPTDWQAVWNTMRIHIRTHDLLPARQVARFVKTPGPIPPHRSIVWEVEPGDDVAHELVKQMYRRLPETAGKLGTLLDQAAGHDGGSHGINSAV